MGAVLIVTKGNFFELITLSFNTGDLLMFTACIFYAGCAVGLRGRPEIDGLVMMAYFSVAALL